jgi:hypothetical protein
LTTSLLGDGLVDLARHAHLVSVAFPAAFVAGVLMCLPATPTTRGG